jgi:CelD/BcsL family acetyltransferase involved in cellulose biosynthesis
VPAAVDPLADPRWRELVARAPGGSVFHHPGWLRLLRDSYRYELSACCVAARDGELLAGLPLATVSSRLTGSRLVALPFSDLCPPLLAADVPADTSRALDEALGDLQRSRGLPLEVRAGGEILPRASPGERFHHHVLALEPDVQAVQQRFAKPQALRGARRALREGLRAEVRTDSGALAGFYRLHVATRHRLGVPTQPRRFILGLEQLFEEGLGFVLLVWRGERAVAAAVFLTFRDVLTYKYGASDPRSLAARPNNLLFMEAIRWGCENGFRSLDFGRTDRGQEGLRAFKLSWGPDERELCYWHLGGSVPRGRDARVESLLAAVIRRTPPVASRLIGEVLYRHAG